jgi:hypothetical protein
MKTLIIRTEQESNQIVEKAKVNIKKIEIMEAFFNFNCQKERNLNSGSNFIEHYED